MRSWIVAVCLAVAVVLPVQVRSQTTDPDPTPPVETTAPMTVERLGALVHAIDADAVTVEERMWRFTVAELPVTVIADPVNDRMRVIVPIADADKLGREILIRMMQANFDTALDARYSVARGVLWSAFIHPLGDLSDDAFLSGVGQTVNLARTFGTTFFSGGLTFGGGDSRGLLERQLIEELLKKKQEI